MGNHWRSCCGCFDIDLNISAVVTRKQRPCEFVHLILLDSTVYETQSKGLVDLVRRTDAKNASELGQSLLGNL